MGERLPGKALDIQLDLLRYYDTDSFGRVYSDGVVEIALANHADWREGAGTNLHRRILATGDTYAVTTEMIDIIAELAPKLPSFRFDASDLPSNLGFVWLERPIVMHDINDRPIVVHAFGWHLTSIFPRDSGFQLGDMLPASIGMQAVTVLGWTNPADPRDFAYSNWDHSKDYPLDMRAPHGLVSMVCAIWPMGEAWDAVSDPERERIGGRSELLQFFVSFLRFIGQKFVDFSPVEPDRYLRKRAARVRGHHLEAVEHVPRIHIVQLRRKYVEPSGEPGEPSTVNWSHRWIVHPFWRNQWYPSEGVHKPIPIAEYIKGPEHLPLVVSDRIFSVER